MPFTVFFIRARNIPVADSRNQPAARERPPHETSSRAFSPPVYFPQDQRPPPEFRAHARHDAVAPGMESADLRSFYCGP